MGLYISCLVRSGDDGRRSVDDGARTDDGVSRRKNASSRTEADVLRTIEAVVRTMDGVSRTNDSIRRDDDGAGRSVDGVHRAIDGVRATKNSVSRKKNDIPRHVDGVFVSVGGVFVSVGGVFVSVGGVFVSGGGVFVSVGAFFRADGDVLGSMDSIFLSADAFFVTAAALDPTTNDGNGSEAAVPRRKDGRLDPARRAAPYLTRSEVGRLQSPCPLFVVVRTRNSTTVATGSPVMVVFACNVFGTSIHVLPPSTLYCHSYDARAATAFAVRWTVPDVAPCRASNDCFWRIGTFFTDRLPELDLIGDVLRQVENGESSMGGGGTSSIARRSVPAATTAPSRHAGVIGRGYGAVALPVSPLRALHPSRKRAILPHPPMPAPHELTIAVRDLDAAGRSYRFALRAGWVRAALEDTGAEPAGADGTLELRASKSGTDVVLRGKLAADLRVPCARCLEPAAVAVREDISVLAVPGSALREASAPGDDDADLAPDQLDVIGYDGETVVLDDLVRDELLLGVPIVPLCSEGCPGISQGPTQQHESAGIDPRLRPLLRLKKSPT